VPLHVYAVDVVEGGKSLHIDQVSNRLQEGTATSEGESLFMLAGQAEPRW